MSFADERALQRKTGCDPNNANFFSILNVNRQCDLTVLFDKELYKADWISAHPMDSSASTLINTDAFEKLLQLSGRSDELKVLNFDDDKELELSVA